MKIYVASIPFRATDDDLKNLFNEYGDVSSAKIITDRETQRSRGFGFVEMEDDSNAQSAIDGLNGTDFMGRTLVVNEARPRPERDFNR